MKKRALIFSIVLALALALFVPFAFAEAECEHSYTDDGDCTTPAVCSICGEATYVCASHNFDKAVSYSYNNEGFVSSGTKKIACSNNGCTQAIEENARMLIDSLGYSIREYVRNDFTYYSLATSYIFNSNEIKSYAGSLGVDYEYGIICYLADLIGNDQPIDGEGDPDVTVLKINYTGADSVRDLTLPSIIDDSANDEFVFAAYLRLGEKVYYVQSDKIFTNYKDLSAVSCNRVLDKLNAQ